MRKIDSIVVLLFQRVSDWFQIWIGINNFVIVRLLSTLLAASVVIVVVLESFQDKRLLYLFDAGALLAYSIGFFVKSITGERKCKNNPQFANPFYEQIRWLRYTIIGLITMSLLFFFFYGVLHTLSMPKKREDLAVLSRPISRITYTYRFIMLISFVCNIFFLCCTPKPPSKSKIKKIIGSMGDLFRKKQLAKA
jgi:hypothetical protein